jgi:hypothetical protein
MFPPLAALKRKTDLGWGTKMDAAVLLLRGRLRRTGIRVVRMESDAVYFGRRAQEERETGLKSADARARQAHLEMADRYDELVLALDGAQSRAEMRGSAG